MNMLNRINNSQSTIMPTPHTQRKYRIELDILKGISIIAVILYHIGILPYGYLGVDAFLIINGYLIIPSLIRKISSEEFSFFQWFSYRLFRVWPITLAAGIVSLVIGYCVMMPDSYENLAQSVVASNLFANNILSIITTKNYWDVANEYKPLMQMWYLGVLVQMYILIPLILIIINKFIPRGNDREKILTISTLIITLISLVLYILQSFPYAEKFYLPQFRLWELCLGGVIGLKNGTGIIKTSWKIGGMYIIFITILCWGMNSIKDIDNITIVGMRLPTDNSYIKELLTISVSLIITGILLIRFPFNDSMNLLAYVGKISLSLFVWHQLILAFCRYALIDELTGTFIFAYLLITIIISLISYQTLEKFRPQSIFVRIGFVFCVALVTALGLYIYSRAGVMRDVPELGISTEHPYTNRNTDYTDRIYSYDRPFNLSHNQRKVLVIGNSFARDFGAILLEYNNTDSIELSYIYSLDRSNALSYKARIQQADYIFIFGSKKAVPEVFYDYVRPSSKIYGIGTKSFGKDFGIIYAKKSSPEYYNTAIKSHPLCDSINKAWRSEWGDSAFIDMMTPVRLKDGRIRLFTEDHMVISFDCRHLTPAGARFYARHIPLDSIFGINTPTFH